MSGLPFICLGCHCGLYYYYGEYSFLRGLGLSVHMDGLYEHLFLSISVRSVGSPRLVFWPTSRNELSFFVKKKREATSKARKYEMLSIFAGSKSTIDMLILMW